MNATEKVWPTEIRLAKDRRTLTIAFESGETFDISAERLRVLSPSAEVQGHTPAQRQIVPAKRNVEIIKIEPVGNYAVRLTFDDLHNSGIFSWPYLLKLGREGDALFAEYEAELEAKGLSRDPK